MATRHLSLPQMELHYSKIGALKINCTKTQANQFLTTPKLSFTNETVWFTETDPQKTTKYFLHSAPTNLSKKDIHKLLKNSHLHNIIRFYHNRMPTKTVQLTFTENYHIPKHMKSNNFIPTRL